jgi:3-oxoacyl-[acyl-carrier protein] reductase
VVGLGTAVVDVPLLEAVIMLVRDRVQPLGVLRCGGGEPQKGDGTNGCDRPTTAQSLSGPAAGRSSPVRPAPEIRTTGTGIQHDRGSLGNDAVVDLNLSGKRAVIGAATQGLGFGCAQALAAEGARVAICGRTSNSVETAVAELGSESIGIVADLSTPSSAVAFIHDARRALGGIDIFVQNTGGPPRGRAAELAIDDYRTAVEAQFLAAVAMCDAVLPGMRTQRWGRIVAITSTSVREPIGVLALSNTTRTALTSYLKSLSVDVAPDGVTVNSVQPGLHATQRVRDLYGDDLASTAGDVPVGRLGDPADFGAVVAFLCSEQANYVTGVALPVDGGAGSGLQ